MTSAPIDPQESSDTKHDGVSVDLSIVLPCYRASTAARAAVEELRTFLEPTPWTWEIIVVDDGSGEGPDAMRLPHDDRVRLVALPRNSGKGAAVRAGILAARGRARVFTDVDLPYEPELILVATECLLRHRYHVVVGDRSLPGSSYASELSAARRLSTRIFGWLVGRVITGGFFDTQCGFKGFRADVARELFALSRLDRFAFDVELIYLALAFRLDIKRIPVRVRPQVRSSVRLVRDSVQMLGDLCRIKLYQWTGSYQSSRLPSILEADFEEIRSSLPSAPRRVCETGGPVAR
jgi:dolichyl-phosphate beta-glucosyltransferase